MKRIISILLAMMMLLSLVACTNNDDTPSGSENTPGTSQSDARGGESADDDVKENNDKETDGGENTADGSEETNGDKETDGGEIGEPWPESDVTALVPTPAQGKVTLASIDETSAIIEVTWTYAEVLAYVQQLQDAGFGDDTVEKFEQFKTLKRTHNGVEVYLVYFDDTWTQINITVQ